MGFFWLVFLCLLPSGSCTNNALTDEDNVLLQLQIRKNFDYSSSPHYYALLQDVSAKDWVIECLRAWQLSALMAKSKPSRIPDKGGGVFWASWFSDYTHQGLPKGICGMNLNSAFQNAELTMDMLDVLIDFNKTGILAEPSKTLSSLMATRDAVPFNLPRKVSFPKSVKDIVEVVRSAGRDKVPISVKTSGHSYSGQWTQHGSYLINLREFVKYTQIPFVQQLLRGNLPMSSVYEFALKDYSGPLPSAVWCPMLSKDALDQYPPCQLAMARKKKATLRVGGGELWDDVNRGVDSLNYYFQEFFGETVEALSGGAGTVGAVGGWMQGGGLADGSERLHGIGVDQVLEVEMVLADGTHIKFGPTKWTDQKGFLYPKTTEVTGYCNRNVVEDESKWKWAHCKIAVPFIQLWQSVRGGGGGTFGIVTAVTYQLHTRRVVEIMQFDQDYSLRSLFAKDCGQYLLTEAAIVMGGWNETSGTLRDSPLVQEFFDFEAYKYWRSNRWPSNITDPVGECMANNMTDCNVELWKICNTTQSHFTDFFIDLFFNPRALNISDDVSRNCGARDFKFSLPSNESGQIICHDGAAAKVKEAWNNHWDQTKDCKYCKYFPMFKDTWNVSVAPSYSALTALGIPAWQNQFLTPPNYQQYVALNGSFYNHTDSYSVRDPSVPLGKTTSLPPGVQDNQGTPSILIPVEYLLNKSRDMYLLVQLTDAHVIGGLSQFSSDQQDAVNSILRISGFQKNLGLWGGPITRHFFPLVQAYYPKPYDRHAISGGIEYNHLGGGSIMKFGPLKEDPSLPCPGTNSTFNDSAKQRACFKVQEFIWGTSKLSFLKTIKRRLDPHNKFRCQFCVQ